MSREIELNSIVVFAAREGRLLIIIANEHVSIPRYFPFYTCELIFYLVSNIFSTYTLCKFYLTKVYIVHKFQITHWYMAQASNSNSIVRSGCVIG